ncbi:MAG TPA: TetR/AcrR family transcriptional regulator [Polyangiaceae bacterium]|nr:TetR/AcrR family transcriptional regulator [Polyangiaceae bacterium]
MQIAKPLRGASRRKANGGASLRVAPLAGGTRDRILDVAERLVQTRGFNGMSYADIAITLRITKASIHYHFPNKADLGTRLISRYEETFLRALASIDASRVDAKKMLRDYVRIYENVLQQDRMCLCGMLAAEHATLPSEMRARLSGFFDANEEWLVRVLERGRSAGSLSFDGPAMATARMLVGSLEGAMLLARSYSQVARFTQVATQLLTALSAPTSSKTSLSSRRA